MGFKDYPVNLIIDGLWSRAETHKARLDVLTELVKGIYYVAVVPFRQTFAPKRLPPKHTWARGGVAPQIWPPPDPPPRPMGPLK